MYKTPFHRRIIPWLYIFIFLGLAPLLIFYTAGYRYNPKKNALEKNGSLIVDSTPTGARVLLDGQFTGETSPVTLQNITPGIHTVKLERAGYLPWEKNLEIRNEQVTFANKIWLWRLTEPTIVSRMSQAQLQTDDQNDFLAVLEPQNPTSSLYILNNNLERQRLISLANTSTDTDWSIRWHTDGRQLFVQNQSQTNQTSIEFGLLQQLKITSLLPGDYAWNGNALVRQTLETQANVQGVYIKTTTSTGEQILVDDGIISNSYALPAGNWHIHLVKRPYVLLQDQDRWLAIQLRKDNPFAGQTVGDKPRWLTDRKIPSAFFRRNNEIWFWELGTTPKLLWRVSEGITQIAWHANSQHLIFSTKTEIKALDLDDRDGRNIITLAQFDDIKDMAVINNTLVIMGTKQDESGLWRLPLE